MHYIIFTLMVTAFFSCQSQTNNPIAHLLRTDSFQQNESHDSSSWAFFLQHLPEKPGPILDYRGRPVPDQQKHAAIISYDVGNKDLQQCADALMRLRAEYLFAQKRYREIHFHFVSGHDYSFDDFCKGKRPVAAGNDIRWVTNAPMAVSHQSLRNYLDIVYGYASTISLAKEMKSANGFSIGTVVIYPGSPGHCFIITNEATTASGDKLYKLVEGYTPAQSIYVLANTAEPQLGYWHRLSKGTIETASYTFSSYSLKTFE